jgi:hypothetical protein
MYKTNAPRKSITSLLLRECLTAAKVLLLVTIAMLVPWLMFALSVALAG